MVFWVPTGTQPGGTGKFRQRCPHGKRGGNGRWKHEWGIGQESHRVHGGQGRNKVAVPLDLHMEICRVRQEHYQVK